MTRTLFIGGSPNPNVDALATELARREGVRFARFHISSMLERLRDATQHRAMAWQGVHAKPPDWIEPAVRRFAPLLVRKLAKDALVFANAHVDNVRHLDLLSTALPEAQFLVLVRDGTVPAAALRQPADACEWAKTWLTFVEPAARLASKLGSRLLVLRDKDLVAEPNAAITRVLDWLHLASPREWIGEHPSASAPMFGEALQCFAAYGPTRKLLAHFGYAVPAIGAACEHQPTVVKELVRSLIDENRLDEAQALLDRVLRTQRSCPALEALGLLQLRRGRETEAVHAFLLALQHDSDSIDAWTQLLALHHRPETTAIAEYARLSPQPAVRAALARWLVARGLDAEAAEIMARVEHQAWQAR